MLHFSSNKFMFVLRWMVKRTLYIRNKVALFIRKKKQQQMALVTAC